MQASSLGGWGGGVGAITVNTDFMPTKFSLPPKECMYIDCIQHIHTLPYILHTYRRVGGWAEV